MFQFHANYVSFLEYCILLIFLPSIFTGFFPGKITVMTVLCGWLFAIFLMNTYRKVIHYSDFDGKRIIQMFIVYMFVLYIRGWGNIDSDTDIYASLGANVFLCFLFPTIIFLSSPKNMYYILHSFLWPGIVLCLICYFYPPSDGMMSLAHNASFLNVFILCIPFVKLKWKLIIPVCVLLVVFWDLDRRSIMINNVFSLLLIALLPIIKRKVAKGIIFISLVLIPIIFGFLAFKGSFNVFEYMNGITYTISNDDRSLLTDSRSSIYEDVFGELKRDDRYTFGLGCNGKTETSLSSLTYADYESIYKYGRPGTESGMLNYIQYGGMLGCLLYSLLLIFAAYKAIFKSNNSFMLLLGLFVAFKFLYSFIEDQIMYNAHSFYIFLWIGMCYNKSFRQKSDFEMKNYFNKIFI